MGEFHTLLFSSGITYKLRQRSTYKSRAVAYQSLSDSFLATTLVGKLQTVTGSLDTLAVARANVDPCHSAPL